MLSVIEPGWARLYKTMQFHYQACSGAHAGRAHAPSESDEGLPGTESPSAWPWYMQQALTWTHETGYAGRARFAKKKKVHARDFRTFIAEPCADHRLSNKSSVDATSCAGLAFPNPSAATRHQSLQISGGEKAMGKATLEGCRGVAAGGSDETFCYGIRSSRK